MSTFTHDTIPTDLNATHWKNFTAQLQYNLQASNENHVMLLPFGPPSGRSTGCLHFPRSGSSSFTALALNKPSFSSSSSSPSSSFSLCPPPPPPALTMFGRAGVEDYQHVERSCIPFARTRTFPLTRWRVRQKVNTRRACSSDTAPARLPPCTHPIPSRAHSRERGPAAAAAVA